MGSPVNRMMRAAEAFFLADETIRGKIGNRMFRGMAETRIVAQDNPDSTIGTKLGQFAEYELSGNERSLLLGAKGGLPVADLSFRFFGQFIAQAAALYDAFYDKIGATGRYAGTWAIGTADATIIKGARWEDSSASDDRDQSIGMAFVQVTLVVPFLV